MRAATSRLLAASLIAMLAVSLLAGTTLAGKGGSGGGGSTGSTSGASVTLVPLYTHSGGPVIGDQVTFKVVTSQPYPFVRVTCKQGGTTVYTDNRGFYPTYPWGQTFTLGPTSLWTSGSAACTAVLYYTSGTKSITLASTSFTVSG